MYEKNKLIFSRRLVFSVPKWSSVSGIQLPPGIRLKNIEPDQGELTLDTMAEKRVPAQADFSGTLPEDKHKKVQIQYTISERKRNDDTQS